MSSVLPSPPPLHNFHGLADDHSTYCFPNNSTNAQYQLWDTAPYGATGLIRLHSNQNLCLDAGSTPSNNGVVKVWTCGNGWAQQQWQQFANQGLVQTTNSEFPPRPPQSGGDLRVPTGSAWAVDRADATLRPMPRRPARVAA